MQGQGRPIALLGMSQKEERARTSEDLRLGTTTQSMLTSQQHSLGQTKRTSLLACSSRDMH